MVVFPGLPRACRSCNVERVQHACYACGEFLEQVVTFCPSCGAPQIKVTSRDPETAVTDDRPSPPPPPASQIAGPPFPYASQINWKSLFRIALPLSAAVGLLTWLEPGLGWLVALPGGIILAINFYRRRQPCLLTASLGAKLGAVVGLLSFVFFSLLFAASSASDAPAFRSAMQKLGQDALARYPTPESQQLAQAWFTGPHAVALIAGTLLASTLFVIMIISVITGALVGAWSQRRHIP